MFAQKGDPLVLVVRRVMRPGKEKKYISDGSH
jgi:hypothetical protein